MRRYAISDSRLLGGVEHLPDWVSTLDRSGVELVQIREKQLGAKELARVVEACLERCQRVRLLVNTRADVALACRAHGVHLSSGAPSAAAWRALAPAGFLLGVSTHSMEEVLRAESDGADFVVLSPVFPPRSKDYSGSQLGIEQFGRICRATALPVYALGGITWDNAGDCLAAGAAGVAGISLFHTSDLASRPMQPE
jgi:thiamine-phosphate pyrophosphorylase